MSVEQLFVMSLLLSLTYLGVMFYLRKDLFDINNPKKGAKIYITVILITTAPLWFIQELSIQARILIFISGVMIWVSKFVGTSRLRKVLRKGKSD